ncbi:MAG: fibrobacter succinogenes major paralogous domain-containing protein [Bacteroidales bacterium]|nr:fibrobacter succinogenes major paralogous domain-containing protein [Bacteroidales bacterium]
MKRTSFVLSIVVAAVASSFAQGDCGTVTDRDGNVYQTVQLGSQCWMRENLRVTHFPDGRPLKLGAETSSTEFFYYYPNGDSTLVSRYGLLYSWNTCLTGKKPTEAVPSGIQSLCPDGWHLPSNFEWMNLEDFLGYKEEHRCGSDVNNVAKAMASHEDWVYNSFSPAPECSIADGSKANNSSGMDVLPAGNFFHTFDGFGVDAGFWTASDGSDVTAPIHHFYVTNATVEINCTPKEAAYSVRCIKD